MRPHSVLVVDNNQVQRRRLVATLEARDYSVLEAGDGLEALDRVRQYRPQMVLMDLHLPVMSCTAATELISREFPWIPIVIMTDFLDNSPKQLFECGAVAELHRPFAMPRLLWLLDRFGPDQP